MQQLAAHLFSICAVIMSWLSVSVAAHAFANVLLKYAKKWKYLLQVHQLQNISHTHTTLTFNSPTLNAPGKHFKEKKE